MWTLTLHPSRATTHGMACSGLPAVERDVTELWEEHERIDERLEQQSLPRPCGRLDLARCRCAAAAARQEGTRRRLNDDGRDEGRDSACALHHGLER